MTRQRARAGAADRVTKRVVATRRGRVTRPAKPPSASLSSEDTMVANDHDAQTEIIDHRYFSLHHAVTMLNDQRDHLSRRAVDDDTVRERITAIWQMVRNAAESYERCFDCFPHARSLPVLRRQSYTVTVDGHRHKHELARTLRFLELAIRVLVLEVFQIDWPSRLREMRPVDAVFDPIRQLAPDLYRRVEAGHLRQQAHCLEATVRQLCDHAFARDFGPYSHDCEFFLHQAVHSAMQLRFDWLPSEHPYVFQLDGGGQIETQQGVDVGRQQDTDWRVVFPSVACADRTVVGSERVENKHDCGRCQARTCSS